ncbi:MAG: hypothetical protein J0652_08205 [Desulfobulbaceae bacterium]|jgi:hypothetical protein|nr:hypothetical protein [Desulfobulbaceae bacterium]
MKKTGVILTVIVVMAVGLYFLVTARIGKVTAADFLPEEILLAVEQQDLGQLLEDYKNSRLGHTITGIDYLKIASDLGMAQEEVDKISGVSKKMGDFFKSPVFKELFGKEFTLALLPVTDINLASPDKAATGSLVFISRPSHDADILKLISSLFIGKLNQTSIQHGKYSIQQIALEEGIVLNVATVQGYIIAALDVGLVQASLDRFDNKSGSKKGTLAQSSEYIRLRQEFTDAKCFVYVSMPTLYSQAGRFAEQLDIPEHDELLKAIDQWKGWNGLAFGAWKEKGQIRDKGVVLFNREKLDPLVAKMCSVKPTDNKTYAMVPADILGYYWTNTLNMGMFWEMFRREMQGSEEQLKAIEKEVKAATGLELDQILAMFGSEAAVLMKEMVTDGFIPLPNGAIFLKIEKEADLLKMVKSQLAKMDIAIQAEEYKGVALNTLDISFHPSLRPVYVMHQGYLILAGSADMVKKIIDSQGSQGLIAEKSFQQVNEGLHKGLTGSNNSVSYVKFSSLLKMIRELANWGGTILSMQDPETGRKSKVVFDQLIFPLLDGLGMYEAMGSRSVIQDDSLIMESTMILAP